MTLTTKAQHRKDRERSESPEWKRCHYCSERRHISELNAKDVEGRWYCDADHKQFYLEEEVEE